MKVLLSRNVDNLGKIGDMVEVKPGYARNYLLPQGLAVHPNPANIRAVEKARQEYLQELAKQRGELEAKAALVNGRQLTISARANEEGHLYGSIGPAQIVAALASDNVFVEPEHVVIEHSIRQLGEVNVAVRFAEGIEAVVHLSVIRLEGGEEAAAPAENAPEGLDAGPDDVQ